MDDFERRFAASLKEVARLSPHEGTPDRPVRRSSPRRRWATPVLAAAAVTTIVGAGAWVAGAGGLGGEDELVPADPGAAQPTQTTEAPPSRAAVIEVADRLAAFRNESGFGKVAVNYAKATVTVFWNGTPPAEVSSWVGKRSEGVLVLLHPATFTQDELLAAGTAAAQTGRERFGESAIAEVYPNNDLSGLIVEATTERVTSEALAGRTGGIPVTVRQVDVGEVVCAYGQECSGRDAD